MNELLEQRLEIFYGEASPALARVYARLESVDLSTDARLSGSISGPHCLYARTLPASWPLVDRSKPGSLLAEAILPEPCFWSADLPQLYEVRVDLHVDGRVAASATRQFGVRLLGARVGSLLWEAKRFVIRGVLYDEVPATPLSDWRECGAVAIVDRPSDEFCREASRVGVLIVARLGPDARDVPSELRRLAHWPAVGMAALPANLDSKFQPRRYAPNLLPCQWSTIDSAKQPAAWAETVVCEVADAGVLRDASIDPSFPLVVARPAGPQRGLFEARSLCDRLQRDLAPAVDAAGYVV